MQRVSTIKRKLVTNVSFERLVAVGHDVDGTRLRVLELLMFGFAYSSRYLLLKARSFDGISDDEQTNTRLGAAASKFGRTLKFGVDLERDAITGDVFYIGPVDECDLVRKNG